MGAVEAVVETAEVIDDVVEAVEHIGNLNGTTRKQQIIILVVVGVGAAVASGAVSHFITKKVLKTRYQELMDEELEITKRFYENREHIAIDKTEPVIDPEDLLRMQQDLLGEEMTKQLDEGENEFVTAGPQAAIIAASEKGEAIQAVKKNAFDNSVDHEALWTAQNDAAIAEGKPYVLSKDEFFEAEHDWPQLSYTWFEGDSVLADERESMVDSVNNVVNDMNLTRFGWKSEDDNTVYIRNPEHEVEIEITRSTGTYAAEVHGFQHSDDTFEARRPKVRYGED